jgi:hypothetical protein
MAIGLTLEQLSAPIDADPDAEPLARLEAAAATAGELRELADALLDRYVQAARAESRSWSEIGAALGVTKQAAHERFVDAPPAWPQKFDEAARTVVARALEDARGFGHRYLGTEHLLLALAEAPGIAATALGARGIDARAVRRSIERIIGRGSSGDGTLGVTPRTKRVFEAAVKEAKRVSGRRCAGCEHLLLALATSDGVAREILGEHGAGAEAVRETLASLLEREDPEAAEKLRMPPKRRGIRRRART